jgi:hypothetical protein
VKAKRTNFRCDQSPRPSNGDEAKPCPKCGCETWHRMELTDRVTPEGMRYRSATQRCRNCEANQ